MFEKLEENLKDISVLENVKNIVVTGATGLIGSNLIKFLIRYRETNNYKYVIYGLCRNKDKLVNLVGLDVVFKYYNMYEMIDLDVDCPVIIHTASPTSTEMFVNNPTKVHNLINQSTFFINDFALRSNALKLIHLSTMEVYGEQTDNILIDEDEFFGIDILNTRNSYPIAKISSENYLLGSYKENSLPVVILRLTQVMAPPIDINDNRVIFQFAKNIVNNENIVLKTSGLTYRSYIYYIDVISAIIISIQNGLDGEVYNVATPNTCVSIVDLANKMIQLGESDVEVEFDFKDDSNLGYRDKLGLCINSEKIIKIGWNPIYSLDSSLNLLLNDLKNLLKY